MTVVSRVICAAMLLYAGTAAAQTTPPPGTARVAGSQPYDLNVYPAMGGQDGLYDLSVASSQKGPPGTIALTNMAPPAAYSFADVMRNTHGFVSAGVSSGNGHDFTAGVSIPIVPGKAELDLAASTGQLPTFKVSGNTGKTPSITYDSYSAGLALHPADNVDAFVGVTGVRLHASGMEGNAFLTPGVNAFPNP